MKRLFVTALSIVSAAFVIHCTVDVKEGPAPAVVTEDAAVDTGTTVQNDAGTDVVTAAETGGEDAQPEAEAAAPVSLCTTYPDKTASGSRYYDLALKILEAAAADCKLGTRFEGFDQLSPYPDECFRVQLLTFAQCTDPLTRKPYTYDETTKDPDEVSCVADMANGTGGSVLLGFFDPGRTVTSADFDEYLKLVKAEAIKWGMSAGDADRLVALANAERGKVVKASGTGLSNSTCSE